MALVEQRWDPVSLLNGEGIKRIHPAGRRAFPWGVPPPYAWPPQPTLLGGEPTRVEWEQWVKQALSTLLARVDVSAGAMVASETVDAAAANKPLPACRSDRELLAEKMRRVKEWPHGIPPEGMGWKIADRVLKPPHGGVVGSKSAFYRAIKINERHAGAARSVSALRPI